METNSPFKTPEDGKTVAIVSYITIVGWLIAYLAMHKDNKTALGSYQLRQTLLLHILYLGTNILAEILIRITLSGTLANLFWIVYVGYIIIWIIGFIGAVQGEKKPIPLIGERAQSMFPSI